MLELESKKEFDHHYYSTYKGFDKSWKELVDLLIQNGLKIDEIKLDDSSGDVSMKVAGGRYSVDEFYEDYDELTKYCDEMMIFFNNRDDMISVNDYNDEIVLYVANPELDLNDMIKEKKMK